MVQYKTTDEIVDGVISGSLDLEIVPDAVLVDAVAVLTARREDTHPDGVFRLLAAVIRAHSREIMTYRKLDDADEGSALAFAEDVLEPDVARLVVEKLKR